MSVLMGVQSAKHQKDYFIRHLRTMKIGRK